MEFWVYIVISTIGILLTLAILQCRPAPPRLLTPQQLDEALLRREAQREEALEQEVQRLQRRVNIARNNRLILTARRDTDRLIEEGEDQWQAKGRAVYGDAWDHPVDGNAPMKELFNMPEAELREIKIEAANRVQLETERRIREDTARANLELQTARTASLSYGSSGNDGGGGGSSGSPAFGAGFAPAFLQAPGLVRPLPPPLPPPPGAAGGALPRPELHAPPPLTARGGRRESKPLIDAPFDDPRFVQPRSEKSARRRGSQPSLSADVRPPNLSTAG